MSSFSAIYLRMPNWIGDLCMTLPCLETLLETGKPVIVCARPWAEELLAAYPLHGFIPLSGQLRQDRKAVKSYRQQQSNNMAYGLLLPDSFSSAAIFRLAGIPCAGHIDDGRRLLLRWPFKKSSTPCHAVQAWYRLTMLSLQAWNLPLAAEAQPPKELALRLNSKHHHIAQQLMADHHLQPGNYILIAPTAVGRHHGKNKVWNGFDTLTRALQSRGHTVVMCPPPAERDQARANAPSAHCLPAVSLGGFAALAKSSQLVVCNDSGVSHIAAAVGAKQLTLFGVTNRNRTGPWSPQAHCLGSDAGWPTMEEVLTKIQTLIPESRAWR